MENLEKNTQEEQSSVDNLNILEPQLIPVKDYSPTDHLIDFTNFYKEIFNCEVNTGNRDLDREIFEAYLDNLFKVDGDVIYELINNHDFTFKDIKNQEEKFLLENKTLREKKEFDKATDDKYRCFEERLVCKFYVDGLKFYRHRARDGVPFSQRARKGYKIDPITKEEVKLTDEELREREQNSLDSAIRRAIAQVKEYMRAHHWEFMVLCTFDDDLTEFFKIDKETNKKIELTEEEERKKAVGYVNNFFYVTRRKKEMSDFKSIMFLERGSQRKEKLHFHGFGSKELEKVLLPYETMHKGFGRSVKKYLPQGVYNLGTDWTKKTQRGKKKRGSWAYGHASAIRLTGENGNIKAINYATKYVLKELLLLRLDDNTQKQIALKKVIRKKRLKLNLTKLDMANLLEITPRQYSRWESKELSILSSATINMVNLRKLEKLLELEEASLTDVKYKKTKHLKSYFKTQNVTKAKKILLKNKAEEHLEVDKRYDFVDILKPKQEVNLQEIFY